MRVFIAVKIKEGNHLTWGAAADMGTGVKDLLQRYGLEYQEMYMDVFVEKGGKLEVVGNGRVKTRSRMDPDYGVDDRLASVPWEATS